MSTANPRGSLVLSIIFLTVVVVCLILIAARKVQEIDTENAQKAQETAKYDAFIVSVSQEVIAIEDKVGRIDTSRFATHDDLDAQATQLEAELRQLMHEPNAYCLWSEPDNKGVVTVSCKRGTP
jgi:hypothetical protein